MKCISFVKMYKEEGEIRAFLPDFFGELQGLDAEIYLEQGYGQRLGFSQADYLQQNPNLHFVSKEEAYAKDIVIVLRAPDEWELQLIPKGTILVSMLHYPTRIRRNKLLKQLGIRTVSMDSLRDDFMDRMMFNASGTSYHGMEVAFDELAKVIDLADPNRDPIQVSVIGMGKVGLFAAKSAGKYGFSKAGKAVPKGTKGVIVQMLPRNITVDKEEMKKILSETDILVDCSTREDTTKYIVDNEMIGYMKPHAILLDLTADPYLEDEDALFVKAFEGIPTGTLDQYVFYPDVPIYDEIPKPVNTTNRRTVVSCDAWPGVQPVECMQVYGIQMLPFIVKLAQKELEDMTTDSHYYFERAIHRATMDYYEKELAAQKQSQEE